MALEGLNWEFWVAFLLGISAWNDTLMWREIWIPGKPGRKFFQFPGDTSCLASLNFKFPATWGCHSRQKSPERRHPKTLNFSILGPHSAKIRCPICWKSNFYIVPVGQTNWPRPFPRGPENLYIKWFSYHSDSNPLLESLWEWAEIQDVPEGRHHSGERDHSLARQRLQVCL